RVGRKTIEITTAVDIPNPNAEATGEHHIEWRVVTCTILLFKGAVFGARRRPRIFQHQFHLQPLRAVRFGQALFRRAPHRAGFSGLMVKTEGHAISSTARHYE